MGVVGCGEGVVYLKPQGVQLILAYSWARPAILVAGKGRGEMFCLFCFFTFITGLGGSVGCASDWRPGGRGFDPRRGRQHSFVEIDHEIFSTVILSLPLIQEGQLSVSGERMCTILVNR